MTIEEQADEALARGVTLMVKSLLPPYYCVEYPEFVEQVENRRAELAAGGSALPGGPRTNNAAMAELTD